MHLNHHRLYIFPSTSNLNYYFSSFFFVLFCLNFHTIHLSFHHFSHIFHHSLVVIFAIFQIQFIFQFLFLHLFLLLFGSSFSTVWSKYTRLVYFDQTHMCLTRLQFSHIFIWWLFSTLYFMTIHYSYSMTL